MPRNDVALRVEVPSLYEEAEKALTNRGEFEEELLGAGGPALEATATVQSSSARVRTLA